MSLLSSLSAGARRLRAMSGAARVPRPVRLAALAGAALASGLHPGRAAAAPMARADSLSASAGLGRVGQGVERPLAAADSVRLSPSFMQALDGAFSLVPQAAPALRPDTPTTQLLHEWVPRPQYMSPLPVGELHVIPRGSISEGISRPLIQFDANALAAYVRPSAIALRRSRELCARQRPAMQAAFPILTADPAGLNALMGPAPADSVGADAAH